MADALVNPLWRRRRESLTSLQTKNVFTIKLADFHGIKFIFVAWNDAESKARMVEMNLVNENGVIKESVHGKIGSIKFHVNANVSGSNLVIEIVNKESFGLTMDIAFIPLGKP